MDRGIGLTLDRGTVVLVELDPTVGHEQRGVRPCVAVSDPAVNEDQRFPLMAVVPITSTAGEGALTRLSALHYPALAGLERDRHPFAGDLRSEAQAVQGRT